MPDATIILAGGSGTRLWPASLRDHPKQLLRIGGGRSLIQLAVLRALLVTPAGPVVVVTSARYVEALARHVAEVTRETPDAAGRLVFLPEPAGRNTAPAIALAAAYLQRTGAGDINALVLTADHVIGPPAQFAADAEAAARLACAGYLVCFGIPPNGPETGYGYIRAGDEMPPGYLVAGFTEKPDRETAESYLATGEYYWNAGMFCFPVSLFLEELSAHAPDVAAPFRAAGGAPWLAVTRGPDGALYADPVALAPLYEPLPSISIDYAVMEKSGRVAMVPARFDWNDVGGWDQVAEISGKERPADTDAPPVIQVDADDNFVDAELPVAICGVSGIHVVVQNGKVLVCRRGAGQLVKRVVEDAAARGHDELL
jgi:mannose-1-phosphate guanylyltransferase/mannose-6-phosphate isomerase